MSGNGEKKVDETADAGAGLKTLLVRSGAGVCKTKTEEARQSDKAKLQRIIDSLRYRRDIFNFAGDYYAKCYYWLVVPSIVLTTLVSIVSAVWPEDDHRLIGKCVVSSLSGLATMLTSLLSLMKYQSKMDMFQSSASQMDALIAQSKFLSEYQVDGHLTRDMASIFIKETEKKIIEIRSNSPPIPLWLQDEAGRAFCLPRPYESASHASGRARIAKRDNYASAKANSETMATFERKGRRSSSWHPEAETRELLWDTGQP